MSPLDHVTHLASVFEHQEIPWVLGGSLASSMRGDPRSTNDVDIAVRLEPQRVAGFVAAVSEDYLASLQPLIEAAERRSSFNLLHIATGFKVDLFFLADTGLDLLQLHRREPLVLGGSEPTLWVTSNVDIVLRKLRWFDLGGRVSDRQWNDILGVLRVQGDAIDVELLRHDASVHGLIDLLEDALTQRG